MKHKHHIIPKHMGGSNHPTNLIPLTVQEHAEEHKILWWLYGCWQDKIAYLTLSGQITKAEANREISRLANIGNKNAVGRKSRGSTGMKLSEETKRKISETLKRKGIKPPVFKGHTQESKDKISASLKRNRYGSAI